MKVLITLITLILLTGCTSEKIKFIQPQIPDPLGKPQVQEYNINIVTFNGVKYYTFTEFDALKASENWIKYKNWAEGNYNLLKSLKNQSLQNTQK